MTDNILSDEEIKDKILSLDDYYYKILYDKYLQLLKCHQSEAAGIAELKEKNHELEVLAESRLDLIKAFQNPIHSVHEQAKAEARKKQLRG